MTHPNSARAFASVADSLSGLRAKVFRALVSARKPLTDEELIRLSRLPANSARPRRIELVSLGVVRDSGRTGVTRSGRKAVRWEVVPR